MVKGFLKFLGKEISGLHEAAYLLAAFAVLSQVAGFVRDRLLAHYYGAGVTLDIYYAAFRIPDFIFVSVASLVSASVLIPFLLENREEEETKKLVNAIFTFFTLFMLVVSAVVFLGMPLLAKVVFPGIKDPESVTTLILYARIMLLSPILLGLSNFLSSITQARRRFLAYAISPVLYNVGIIIGILFLSHQFGVVGVVWGVVLGGILHLSVQIPALISARLLPRFDIRANFVLVKNVILISFPRTLTLSTNHISMLFLVAFASLMTVGSISVFNFSFNLQSVPLSIIGVSYSMAAFPTLSRLFGLGEKDAFITEIVNAGRHIIFWSMPVTILFIVLRAQIVRTVLGSGNFNWSDTRLTAAAFALFAVSALAQSLILLFVRGYYSASFTKKPLTINVLSAVITVVVTYALIKLFGTSMYFRDFVESLLRVQDIPGTAVLMLPLGFSIGQIINAILHWVYFEKDFASVHSRLFKTFFETSGAALIMGYVAYQLLGVFDNVFNLETLPGIFLQGFCSGIGGIIVGIVVLIMLKNDELVEVWRALHEKIWKASAIVPEQESL